jgi:hypothetical protein
LNCSNLSSGNVGKAYSSTCYTYGGTPPFAYSIVAGALPPGLTLNSSTGAVTGVPTTPNTFSFTVSVTDSSSPAQTATDEMQLPIEPTEGMGIFCPMNDSASLGTTYWEYCIIFGGNQPYTVSIVAGALPPGISLNSSNAVFSGTPTIMGTYSYTVQATDSSSPPQSVQGPGSIIVGPAPPETALVTITATSGGIVNTTTISVTVP